LPQLAQGQGSTFWVIPSEVTSALKAVTSAFEGQKGEADPGPGLDAALAGMAGLAGLASGNGGSVPSTASPNVTSPGIAGPAGPTHADQDGAALDGSPWDTVGR